MTFPGSAVPHRLSRTPRRHNRSLGFSARGSANSQRIHYLRHNAYIPANRTVRWRLHIGVGRERSVLGPPIGGLAGEILSLARGRLPSRTTSRSPPRQPVHPCGRASPPQLTRWSSLCSVTAVVGRYYPTATPKSNRWLGSRNRQRGQVRVSGQVNDGAGLVILCMMGTVACRLFAYDDQYGSGLIVLCRSSGIRKAVTRDRSAGLCKFKINRRTVSDIGYRHGTRHPRHGTKHPSFQRRWSIYLFCRVLQPGHASGSSASAGVVRGSLGRGPVVVDDNRRLRKWAVLKLGDIMRRVIIRSLAVTAVFTGLLFTGVGVASANPVATANPPCYLLPTSCP